MTNNYNVILSKTSYNKGEFNESVYNYEFQTYEEALEKYEDLVVSESKHISGLFFVKSDATIVVYDQYKQIRRRLKISN